MSTTNSHKVLIKGAITGGAMNAVTSGIMNWFSVKDKESLLLSDDLISSTKQTVFAGAVPAALFLALVITSMTYLKIKQPNKPAYFPKVFFLALQHAVFAFGAVTIVAILIQRFFGSITVIPIQSVLISATVAGLVGGVVDYMTKKKLLS